MGGIKLIACNLRKINSVAKKNTRLISKVFDHHVCIVLMFITFVSFMFFLIFKQ